MTAVKTWRRVVLESPYAGDIALNERYARACVADCLRRGEAPIASHLLYTQPGVLDDDVPAERATGIAAGLAWLAAADAMVVYTDLGHSPGMIDAVKHAHRHGRTVLSVEFRTLPPPLDLRVLRGHVAFSKPTGGSHE